MSTLFAKEIEFFPLSHLASRAAKLIEPEVRTIYSSTFPRKVSDLVGNTPAYYTRTNEIQIIACRDINVNLRLSLQMALRIADQAPDCDGFGTMTSSWGVDPCDREATPLEKEKLGRDRVTLADFTKDPRETGWVNGKAPKVLYINSYASESRLEREAAWLVDRGHAPYRQAMGFGVVNCPIGCWAQKLETIRQLIQLNEFSVLVLNSLEFTAVSQREKNAIALELLRLKEEYGVAVIVFTQDVRKNMEAGIFGRGPLGFLQNVAASVVKIDEEVGVWSEPVEDPAKQYATHDHIPDTLVRAATNYEKSLNTQGESVTFELVSAGGTIGGNANCPVMGPEFKMDEGFTLC